MRAGEAAGAMMSGSGATVFGLFANPASARSCAQVIGEQFGPSMWTQVTSFRST
jgi:4-diphosphocytidyl-2C-methyl-D-erythritol kinase